MRTKKIKAVFKGADGSCGFYTDKEYELIVTHTKGENINIKDKNYTGGFTLTCNYESMISFLSNWDKITLE